MNAQTAEDQRVVTATEAGQALDALRATRPLVQNITNFVSMDIAANALLAIGASPAMVHAVEELDEFGGYIGALVINIGTLSAAWTDAMDMAAAGARRRAKPWVLDPVGAGATRFRTETVLRLLKHGPAVIRGNTSEVLAIAGALGLSAAAARNKGVDSGNTADEAAGVAEALARDTGAIVVATGAVDLVTDGTRSLRLANGSPVMGQVTAVGCALSAVTGAFCAVVAPLEAAVAAAACFGVAGEMAAANFPAAGIVQGGVHRRACGAPPGRPRRAHEARMTVDISAYRLCLVTDRDLARGRPLVEVVSRAVMGGVTMVQLRDKSATTRAFVEEARALKSVLAGKGVPLIVNDRVDIALAIGADGVHVGQHDMSVEAVRSLVGPGKIIGLSITRRDANRPHRRRGGGLSRDRPGAPAEDEARCGDAARPRWLRQAPQAHQKAGPRDRRRQGGRRPDAGRRGCRRRRGRQRHHGG